MEKRHRVFIAINLPADIKNALALYAGKWPELPAKWIAKDNLHITLEFLGDLTDVEIADVCRVAGEVAKNHKTFSVTLNNIHLVPKMVWASGEKSKELSGLKNDLQKELLNRVFAPHITLARISEWQLKTIDLEERPEINENINLVFTVESIEVMESELKRGGPQYTILESHNLGE